MAELFHNIRLPKAVEQGAHGGPTFHTTVTTLSSGNEQRNADWSLDLPEWDIGFGIMSAAQFYAVRQFFYARRGMAFAFRFQDWSDYNAPDVSSGLTQEPLGTGNGSNTLFQAIKTYEASGPQPYVRKITRLVDGSYTDPDTGLTVPNTVSVYVNGVLQTLGTSYTLSSTGLVTFASAPGIGASVTYVAQFDCPVRFNVDKFDMSLTLFNAGQIPHLPILGQRE